MALHFIPYDLSFTSFFDFMMFSIEVKERCLGKDVGCNYFDYSTAAQDSSGTCARILFVDFNPTFNTFSLALLQDKLSIPDSTRRSQITDFLSDTRQHVKLGKHIFDYQNHRHQFL